MLNHTSECKAYENNEPGAHKAECEACKQEFESSKHVCPFCWKPVSNSVYFGKRGKSVHLDGKCRERFDMPASFVARKSTAKRSVDPLAGYWASSNDAEENQRAYGSGSTERAPRASLTKTLEKQRADADERLSRAFDKFKKPVEPVSIVELEPVEPVAIVEPVEIVPEPVQAEVEIQAYPVELDPLQVRLAALLEEQNALLRKLAGKTRVEPKPVEICQVSRPVVTVLTKSLTRDAIVKAKSTGMDSAIEF